MVLLLFFFCSSEINKDMDPTIGIFINDGIWEQQEGNGLAETRNFIRHNTSLDAIPEKE